MIIFTKFHEDRTKNVDFLLTANFGTCLIFFTQTLFTKNIDFSWIVFQIWSIKSGVLCHIQKEKFFLILKFYWIISNDALFTVQFRIVQRVHMKLIDYEKLFDFIFIVDFMSTLCQLFSFVSYTFRHPNVSIHSFNQLISSRYVYSLYIWWKCLPNLRKGEQETIDFKNIMFLKMDNFHHKISDNMHICSGVMLNNTMVSSRLLLKNRLSFFITH